MTSDYEKISFIAFANLFAENIPSSLTYKINYLKTFNNIYASKKSQNNFN